MKKARTKELLELLEYFDNRGIKRRDVAGKTGLSPGSISNIFCMADPLSDSAKYKIMAAFRDTITILLPAPAEAEQESPE